MSYVRTEIHTVRCDWPGCGKEHCPVAHIDGRDYCSEHFHYDGDSGELVAGPKETPLSDEALLPRQNGKTEQTLQNTIDEILATFDEHDRALQQQAWDDGYLQCSHATTLHRITPNPYKKTKENQ